jgi:hypothetical protein
MSKDGRDAGASGFLSPRAQRQRMSSPTELQILTEYFFVRKNADPLPGKTWLGCDLAWCSGQWHSLGDQSIRANLVSSLKRLAVAKAFHEQLLELLAGTLASTTSPKEPKHFPRDLASPGCRRLLRQAWSDTLVMRREGHKGRGRFKEERNNNDPAHFFSSCNFLQVSPCVSALFDVRRFRQAPRENPRPFPAYVPRFWSNLSPFVCFRWSNPSVREGGGGCGGVLERG